MVIARYSLARASFGLAFLSGLVYLVCYQIPFVEERGNFQAIFRLGGPALLLPLAWVASIYLVPLLASALYCLILLRGNALRVEGDSLIYILPWYFSVDLSKVSKVYAAAEPSFLQNVIVVTESGRKRYVPLSVLDRKAEDIVPLIEAEVARRRGLTPRP